MERIRYLCVGDGEDGGLGRAAARRCRVANWAGAALDGPGYGPAVGGGPPGASFCTCVGWESLPLGGAALAITPI